MARNRKFTTSGKIIIGTILIAIFLSLGGYSVISKIIKEIQIAMLEEPK